MSGLFQLDARKALRTKPEWATESNPWYTPCPAIGQKRMVFCVDIGGAPWSEIAATSRAKYAARVGANCLTVRHSVLPYDGLVWQKFAVYEQLRAGYTVLVVDNDAVITFACPDIFSFPRGHWYVAKDHNSMLNKKSRFGVIDSIQQTADALSLPLEITEPGFNAGVMLVTPAQRRFFKPGPWIKHLWGSSLVEQAYLNVCALTFPKQAKLHYLPIEFNCVHPTAGQTPWVVHAAGRPDKASFLASWATA